MMIVGVLLVVVILAALVYLFLQNQNKAPMPAATGKPIEEEEGTTVRVVGHRLVRLVGGVKVGSEIPIINKLTIGRDSDCTLCLQDPELSQQHAVVSVEKDKANVVDEGSTNGTWVNDEKIEPEQPRPLNDGDRIKLGGTTLVYKSKA
jgi:pSer/pThr/pTyr-binding forkhead associated (FHA) protein